MVDDTARGLRTVIVEVDPGDSVPVYEQLRVQMARLITAGSLVAGTQLPTIRQLASDLSLAKDTVARTYELLERGGLVERHGRRGTIVADRVGHPTHPNGQLDPAVRELAKVAVQLGVTRDEACRRLCLAMDSIS